MKKLLGLIAPLLRSKKVQMFVVTILANIGVRYVGLPEEVAKEVANGIVKLGLGVIVLQGVTDAATGGRTSANGPDA